MAGFYYKGQLNGADNPVTIHRTIANSETITLGGIVKNSSGYIAAATANDTPVLGVVVGLVNAKGIDLENADSSTYDGTYTEGGVGVQKYVAAADNVTDKQVQAVIVTDPWALWKNDADADLTEAMVFSFFSILNATQIDGDTNSATVGELQLIKRDPDDESDNSQGLFRISSSAMYSYEPET